MFWLDPRRELDLSKTHITLWKCWSWRRIQMKAYIMCSLCVCMHVCVCMCMYVLAFGERETAFQHLSLLMPLRKDSDRYEGRNWETWWFYFVIGFSCLYYIQFPLLRKDHTKRTHSERTLPTGYKSKSV